MSDEQSTAETPHEEEPFDRAMRILREPFPDNVIGLLPRAVRKDDREKGKCEDTQQNRRWSADGKFCGGWHARSVHLDYVGHAATTDRLLSADPFWTWEPVAADERGLPLIVNGGLWIRLTVAGVTRLGYGDAPGKRDATKELIGDAIRNAAMRFGVALDLWAKGDLRANETETGTDEPPVTRSAANGPSAPSSTGQGTPSPESGSEGRGAMPPEIRQQWRTAVLGAEFLGNDPAKGEKPDAGLRTKFQEAKQAGILRERLAENAEETFLDVFQRLSRELPERPEPQEEPMALGDDGGWGAPASTNGAWSQ